MDPHGDQNPGEPGDPNPEDPPIRTFREEGKDLNFPSCKFLNEATISLIEPNPRDRLIGDTGGDSSGGDDRKGIVFTHEAAAASIACLSGK
ncbi:hypothetical protein ACFX13_007465 [Malus domestica]